jgi:preprotein translocase subunit SecF
MGKIIRRIGSFLLPVSILGFALYLIFGLGNKTPLKDRLLRSLDFRGGTRLEYKMNRAAVIKKGWQPAQCHDALKQAQRVFLFRLRNFDLTENAVETLGNDTIVLTLPNAEGIEDVVNRTGNVTFRRIDSLNPLTEEDLEKSEKWWFGDEAIGADEIDYHSTKVDTIRNRSGFPEYFVTLSWVSRCKKHAMEQLSRLYPDGILAVCIDDKIDSLLRVESPEIDNAAIGPYTSRRDAEDLAKVLGGGYLPVSFDLVSKTLVGPRLAQELRDRAWVVTLVAAGLILLPFFLRCIDDMGMMIVCCAALMVCTLSFFCLLLTGITTLSTTTLCAYVTLASMAVDNLILVFEQFRHLSRFDRMGRVGLARIVAHLSEAYNSEKNIIFIANLSTACAIGGLIFTEGPARDLAMATCIGLVITWATTVWYPSWLYGSVGLFRVLEQFNIRRTPLLRLEWNIFGSGIQVPLFFFYAAAFIGAVTCIVTRGVNNHVDAKTPMWLRGFAPGLDLEGGTEIQISSDVGLDDDVIRTSTESYFDRRCTVFRLGGDEQDGHFRYAIRVTGKNPFNSGILETHTQTPSDSQSHAQYLEVLQKATDSRTVRFEGEQAVGGTELALNRNVLFISAGSALLALALIVSVCYDFAASFYSVLAMITDGIIALGAMSLFQVPLTVPVAGAVLTLMGFSLYDSILLCGHLRMARKAGQDFAEVLAPLSARLLLISAATFGASIALWVFGRAIMRDFGIVMATGVLFGLMSSITIVSFGVRRSWGQSQTAQALDK